ncbi:MAG TPA: PAS domain S-box protein [Niabella sp.]|nr:PAS domain S-box protein [Niabella sp.]
MSDIPTGNDPYSPFAEAGKNLLIATYVICIPSRKIVYNNCDIRISLGFSEQELASMSSTESFLLYHPEDYPVIRDFYKNPKDIKDLYDQFVYYRHLDHSGSWVLLRASKRILKTDEKGKVSQVLVTVEKVNRQEGDTEHRDTGETEQQTIDKYRTLFHNMDEGYCIIQMLYNSQGLCNNWRFLEVNPAFERHNGLVNATGKTILEVTPGIEQVWFDIYGRVAETGKSIRFEQQSDALQRTFNLYAFRVGDPVERKIAVLFTDITAQKMSGEALRKSEEHNRAIVSQTSVGIFGADLDGHITFLNEKASQLFGLAKNEGIGVNVLDMTVPEFREATVQKFGKLIAEGRSFESEKRMFRKDGSEFWANVSVAGISNQLGEIKSVVAVVIDITQRKAAETALRESEQQLKQLLRLKDDFIGIASHELKTPVTSMKAYAEIVKESMEQLGDKQNSYLLSRLNQQIDRLTTLIRHLLDTSRISEGQLQLASENVDINRLLLERVDEIKRTTGHQFVCHLGKLPEVPGDRERLAQVMTNLLSNSVKYAPAHTTITVSSELEGNAVRVTVQDEGPGIATADQEKIFEKFFRSGTKVMSTYQGMGLGLYITAQIIQKHGGELGVQSEDGRGAAFSFTLPIRKEIVT